MSVQRLRDAGFSVRLKPDDMIGVTPIERLTDAQVAWIKTNKAALLKELKRESANDGANNADIRWDEFIGVCSAHDLSRADIERAIPDTDERLIVAGDPVETWPAWAETTAAALRWMSKPEIAAANNAKPAPELRRCCDCKHDKHSLVNPTGGLTTCRVRDDVPPMLPGTRNNQCAKFVMNKINQSIKQDGHDD